MRLQILLIMLIWAATIACGEVRVSEDTPNTPNIVLIFADDLGYGDVSAYDPNQKIKTPNLDRLASQGRIFTDAHSASGVCTPSRYSLLTGRYSWRTELKQGVLGGFSKPLLERGRWTLGDLFSKHGYATACVGKWHLGMQWSRPDRGDQEYAMRNDAADVEFGEAIELGPTTNGFDYYFGISASLDMPPYAFIENDRVTDLPTSTLEQEDKGGRAGPAVPGWRHKFVLSTITDKGIEFIEKNRDDSFFLYLPLNAPHTPHAPGGDFVGSSGLDTYGDFVVEVDYQAGRIMEALRQNGVQENTLLIVTSDNGPEVNMFPRLARTGHDSSSHFLGAKRDNWEGGHRVPFIAQWPGVIEPGSKSHTPFSLVDMMATFSDILGSPLPEDQGVDSVTILPLLKGESGAYREKHAIIHHSSKGLFAIRLGDWKLLLHSGSGGNGYHQERFANTLEQESHASLDLQLFDLGSDPDETVNLVSQYPERVEELTSLAAAYITDGRSTLGPSKDYVSDNWPQVDWIESRKAGQEE